jgi:probable blue pigment (indigoidine) exporter
MSRLEQIPGRLKPQQKDTRPVSLFIAGIAFAILWPSAATASKIALVYAQPFVIAVFRFFIAGSIMIFISHIILRNRLPTRREWRQLAVYGLLNITLYLGLFIVAMQFISPGLGSLSIATNPVLITHINTFILRRPVKRKVIYSLILCASGVLLAAWPLFVTSHATPGGLGMLMGSMLLYSLGVIYFSEHKWNDLHILTLNGWQTLIGGTFLLPAMAFTWRPAENQMTWPFLTSVLWLAIPVSIFAIQLWLYLLKESPVKASFWLFLCPISGFVIAKIMVNEPITIFTVSGMILVIVGLYLVQKPKTTVVASD